MWLVLYGWFGTVRYCWLVRYGWLVGYAGSCATSDGTPAELLRGRFSTALWRRSGTETARNISPEPARVLGTRAPQAKLIPGRTYRTSELPLRREDLATDAKHSGALSVYVAGIAPELRTAPRKTWRHRRTRPENKTRTAAQELPATQERQKLLPWWRSCPGSPAPSSAAEATPSSLIRTWTSSARWRVPAAEIFRTFREGERSPAAPIARPRVSVWLCTVRYGMVLLGTVRYGYAGSCATSAAFRRSSCGKRAELRKMAVFPAFLAENCEKSQKKKALASVEKDATTFSETCFSTLHLDKIDRSGV